MGLDDPAIRLAKLRAGLAEQHALMPRVDANGKPVVEPPEPPAPAPVVDPPRVDLRQGNRGAAPAAPTRKLSLRDQSRAVFYAANQGVTYDEATRALFGDG